MFDARLYRAALVPAILALVVAAFSLQNRPAGVTSQLPPDAFDGVQASRQLSTMAARFPDRRPGSDGDERLAQYVGQQLKRRAIGGERPFDVSIRRFDGQTIDGRKTLANVIATRAGEPGPGLLIVAHRDSAYRGSAAELSGTAALLELGRVFADGRLTRTTTLVSTSGGSGGNAGAAQLAASVPQPVSAVLVLGDVAGQGVARPMVVTTSDGRGFAPIALQRTIESAVRAEAGVAPGSMSAAQQFARLAFPFAPDEQGTLLRDGLPAVLLQVSGEQGPRGSNALAPGRLETFGRAALRAITALDTGRTLSSEPRSDIVVLDKVLPAWAMRVLVAALLLAPLLLAIDGCARVRRRGGRVLAWVGWAVAGGLPFALTAATLVLLGTTGALRTRPPAPVLPGVIPVAAWTFVVALLVFALGWGIRYLAVRALPVRATSLREEGAGPAVLLVLTVLAIVVWALNPFAALLLVLPAHLWIPVLAAGVRVRRGLGVAVVLATLVPIVLVLASVADQLGYDAGRFAWAIVLALAGDAIGPTAWLAWSLFFGLVVSATILAVRGQPDPAPRPEVTSRGPVSYAGPGSLGGTSSAIRR
jgi:hypothetical protein